MVQKLSRNRSLFRLRWWFSSESIFFVGSRRVARAG
jgi:hypothetical protein